MRRFVSARLARFAPSRGALALAGALGLFSAAGVALRSATRTPSPRAGRPIAVATYNVRRFGFEPTDMPALARVLEGVQADVYALQEVESALRAQRLAERLSQGGRRYRAVVSACGGRSAMHLGFVYDEARVTLGAVREYPNLDEEGEGVCHDGDRPGFFAVFRPREGARLFALLTVHFSAGDSRERAQRRRAQWASALAIAAREERSSGVPTVLLGDVNSTGWLSGGHDERAFIEARARESGRVIATQPLRCSEYYRDGRAGLAPSMLDHVVGPEAVFARAPGSHPGQALVHGYCASLACERYERERPPDEYLRVSDHCPVRVELASEAD